MGRKNLNDLLDYSQRIKEKRPAPDAPRPSLSEENQLELAKRRSILDQVGRYAFQAGSSRLLSLNSEKEKKREAAAARLHKRGEGDPHIGTGFQTPDLPVVNPGTAIVPSTFPEISSRKRSLPPGEERPDSSKQARINHRWGFRYMERDIPFVSTTDACTT